MINLVPCLGGSPNTVTYSLLQCMFQYILKLPDLHEHIKNFKLSKFFETNLEIIIRALSKVQTVY